MSHLPVGIVTLLMTDIEGSARILGISADSFRKLWGHNRDLYDRGDLSPVREVEENEFLSIENNLDLAVAGIDRDRVIRWRRRLVIAADQEIIVSGECRSGDFLTRKRALIL